MSIGRVCVYEAYLQQCLNTKSSTEAKIFGVSDILLKSLWNRHFLEAQGYKINDNIVYQDNMRSIKLQNNGRSSNSNKTRHISIRYFLISDRVNSKESLVEHCPTDDMINDSFTKILQGYKFNKCINIVINI